MLNHGLHTKNPGCCRARLGNHSSESRVPHVEHDDQRLQATYTVRGYSASPAPLAPSGRGCGCDHTCICTLWQLEYVLRWDGRSENTDSGYTSLAISRRSFTEIYVCAVYKMLRPSVLSIKWPVRPCLDGRSIPSHIITFFFTAAVILSIVYSCLSCITSDRIILTHVTSNNYQSTCRVHAPLRWMSTSILRKSPRQPSCADRQTDSANILPRSRGAPRVSSAEARRLQEERLKSFNADNGNSLYPRLWDRAGQQQQQPTQQYNGGQSSGRSNAS